MQHALHAPDGDARLRPCRRPERAPGRAGWRRRHARGQRRSSRPRQRPAPAAPSGFVSGRAGRGGAWPGHQPHRARAPALRLRGATPAPTLAASWGGCPASTCSSTAAPTDGELAATSPPAFRAAAPGPPTTTGRPRGARRIFAAFRRNPGRGGSDPGDGWDSPSPRSPLPCWRTSGGAPLDERGQRPDGSHQRPNTSGTATAGVAGLRPDPSKASGSPDSLARRWAIGGRPAIFVASSSASSRQPSTGATRETSPKRSASWRTAGGP